MAYIHKLFDYYNYIQAVHLYILLYLHTVGRYNSYTTCSLYSIPVMETVMCVMKMGNIAPREGFEPTLLTQF